MAERLLTQRELKKIRDAEKAKKDSAVIVHNCCKQLVLLQIVRQPKTGKKLDFYFAQQSIPLNPGKTVKLAKREVMMHQLKNLQAKKFIRILSEGND